MLKRHPINQQRGQYLSHWEQLVVIILKGGYIEGVRGEAWAVPCPSGEHNVYLLISHATLVEAIYVAAERQPKNPYVQQTFKLGIQCKVFHPMTPMYILVFLKKTP